MDVAGSLFKYFTKGNTRLLSVRIYFTKQQAQIFYGKSTIVQKMVQDPKIKIFTYFVSPHL